MAATVSRVVDEVLRVVQLFGRAYWLGRIGLASCAIMLAYELDLFTPSEAFARATSPRAQTAIPRPPGPLLLLISIRKQKIRAYDANGEVASSRISSGRPGFDTPTGVFSVLEKHEDHESNIYEGAAMPFMQRLTWSGIALHAGVVPGYRASHGCIRLPASFAKSLFDLTKLGNRVVVTADEAVPLPFNHPKLFKPLPAETSPSVASRHSSEETKVAVNDAGSLGQMPQFLGVSIALAEAVRDPTAFAPERPQSRADLDRIATEKTRRLQLALKSAEAKKVLASERAKRAVKDADAVADKFTAAKVVIDPVRASLAANEKKLAQALADFQGFMKQQLVKQPIPSLSKTKAASEAPRSAGELEAEFEEGILDATLDVDANRAELARLEMEFAAVQAVSSVAETARNAALEDVRQNLIQLRFAQTDLIEWNKSVVRRAKPISIFISFKTERIYIRQGVDPLLEAPITIEGPVRRVGTHVFTAMRYAPDANTFDWHLVTAQLPAVIETIDEDGARKKKREIAVPRTAEGSASMARAALEAIKIPPDILDTITELARPGISLIVSDRELPANENGAGTEFVVLTR